MTGGVGSLFFFYVAAHDWLGLNTTVSVVIAIVTFPIYFFILATIAYWINEYFPSFVRSLQIKRHSTRKEPAESAVPKHLMVRGVAALAVVIAGRRRSYLRETWLSDPLNDHGFPAAARYRVVKHVTGYLIAAARFRIRDSMKLLGQLLDFILISRQRTLVITAILFSIPAAMVLHREGFYGLFLESSQLALIGGGLWAGIRWLRKWREVEPPKPTRKSHPTNKT